MFNLFSTLFKFYNTCIKFKNSNVQNSIFNYLDYRSVPGQDKLKLICLEISWFVTHSSLGRALEHESKGQGFESYCVVASNFSLFPFFQLRQVQYSLKYKQKSFVLCSATNHIVHSNQFVYHSTQQW